MKTVIIRSAIILTIALLTSAQLGAQGTDVTGVWVFTVATDQGSGTPTLTFKQDGEKLTGKYEGQLGNADLTGTVKGSAITFTFTVDVQGQQAPVTYKGTVEKNTMKGTLDIAGMVNGTFTAAKKEVCLAVRAGDGDRARPAITEASATARGSTRRPRAPRREELRVVVADGGGDDDGVGVAEVRRVVPEVRRGRPARAAPAASASRGGRCRRPAIPRASRIRAMPLMPAPPMPTKWTAPQPSAGEARIRPGGDVRRFIGRDSSTMRASFSSASRGTSRRGGGAHPRRARRGR